MKYFLIFLGIAVITSCTTIYSTKIDNIDQYQKPYQIEITKNVYRCSTNTNQYQLILHDNFQKREISNTTKESFENLSGRNYSFSKNNFPLSTIQISQNSKIVINNKSTISTENTKNIISININGIHSEFEINNNSTKNYFTASNDYSIVFQYYADSTDQSKNSINKPSGFKILVNGKNAGILTLYNKPKIYLLKELSSISSELEDEIFMYCLCVYENYVTNLNRIY